MSPLPRRRLAAAAALVVLVTGGAACSSGSDSGSDSAGGGSASVAGGSADAPAASGGGREEAAFADGARVAALDVAGDEGAADRKVISTGNVALRADDVAQARFDVQQVVDQYAGEVAQEETATDEEGEVVRSRLVLRLPSADFAEAMADLEDVADLVTSSTGNDDVTTKVLDVGIRVRVQRRSIRRIELLLDRAQTIRDIVAIEAQLSRRQAALASLEQQQAYLADQTSMATVTVSLQRTAEPAARTEPADDAGFLSGLSAGWRGLVTVAVAAATVAGALLPFAAVGLLLGVPAWALLRRLRRRPGRAVAGSQGSHG